jgi:peptidoglycan/xylan/chitin deacetylase (PgdA/CDA1 family)
MWLSPSQVIHRMIYPTLGNVGYFHVHPTSAVSVITYHGVLPDGYNSNDAFLDNTLVSVESFRAQLRLLKEYYNVISPDLFLQWLRGREDLPERSVVLSCDDGLLNHVTSMLPILQEEELKCIFFVTGASLSPEPAMLWYTELYLMLMAATEQTDPISLQGHLIARLSSDVGQRRSVWLGLLKVLSRIDAEMRRGFIAELTARLGLHPSWKSRYLEDPVLRGRFQLLRVPELKQLAGAGMTLGSHTLSHPALAELSSDLARAEIAECRRGLESALGSPVWAIAYPFGDPASVSDREYRLAEEAGYECGFVNVGGGLKSQSPKFALSRIHVTAEMSLEVYEAYISGFHEDLRRTFGPRARRTSARHANRKQ